ncbi:hydrogenase maturation protease [Ferroglobus placidus DSM 10642]|uniref:Hydrogenase maturation protease n=1 Tax=Ferroglobus placidus (strain DSM 10642 / AEDII12DO) TaxID=589924 RepID=D3RWZ7_FERPA|nr:hydrogenase maturation protease [Ferroglobus placidus]ADC65010.1 hydrogenase maturation protease [Ferroglobus placidus DSM 10642]
MRKVVVGVGNPNVPKDSAGWIVAEEAAKVCGVDKILLSTTSFEILDVLLEYDYAVVVDTALGEEGRIRVLDLEELKNAEMTLKTTHSLDLLTTLKIGLELFENIAYTKVVLVEVKDLNGEMDDAFKRRLKEASKIVITLLSAKNLYPRESKIIRR